MSLLAPETRVRELMHRGVVTCPRYAPMADVAKLLFDHQVHAVFVVDDREPIGVISDTDLLIGEWLGGDGDGIRVMRETRASDVMSAPVESIDADAAAGEAADRLLGRGRLLVREGGRPVGVISVSDLVRAMAQPAHGRRSVADVMTRAFVACHESTALADVARAMSERRSRSVVVLDDDGAPAGIVTGHDLLRAAQDGADAAAQPVGAVMSPALRTVAPDTPLSEAADGMLADEVHRLLVADADEPRRILGLVATSDVVAEIAQSADWRS